LLAPPKSSRIHFVTVKGFIFRGKKKKQQSQPDDPSPEKKQRQKKVYVPNDVKYFVFRTVRSPANQKILTDHKTTNYHEKGRVWDEIVATINNVRFFVIF
jgi:hypothetical protein